MKAKLLSLAASLKPLLNKLKIAAIKEPNAISLIPCFPFLLL